MYDATESFPVHPHEVRACGVNEGTFNPVIALNPDSSQNSYELKGKHFVLRSEIDHELLEIASSLQFRSGLRARRHLDVS